MCEKLPGCSAVLLAGGQSTRFGRDKAGFLFGGRPLAGYGLDFLSAWFDDVLVAAPGVWLGARALSDRFVAAGPMAGIEAALDSAREEWLFVLACDMPFPDARVMRRLWEARTEGALAIIPSWRKGIEPLFSFYSRACLEPARQLLRAKRYSLRWLLDAVPVTRVDLEHDPIFAGLLEKCFFNINTPGDATTQPR